MRLFMGTGRAYLWCLIAFMKVTTVSTTPHDLLFAFKHTPCLNISGKI